MKTDLSSQSFPRHIPRIEIEKACLPRIPITLGRNLPRKRLWEDHGKVGSP